MQLITITVASWDKYNARKDVKNATWFRMSNDFMYNPKMYKWTPNERLLYIAILCQCSKKCSNRVQMNTEWISDTCSMNTQEIYDTLDKLQQLEMVTWECSSTDVNEKLLSSHVPYRQTDKQTNIQTNNNAHSSEMNTSDEHPGPQAKRRRTMSARTKFEREIFPLLENAYQEFYPRKVGKTRGLARLLKEIKTESDVEDFIAAVKNYAQYTATNLTEEKFIKHFSTFVSEWRDWIKTPETQMEDLSWAETLTD